jgi:hypothetical protein
VAFAGKVTRSSTPLQDFLKFFKISTQKLICAPLLESRAELGGERMVDWAAGSNASAGGWEHKKILWKVGLTRSPEICKELPYKCEVFITLAL